MDEHRRGQRAVERRLLVVLEDHPERVAHLEQPDLVHVDPTTRRHVVVVRDRTTARTSRDSPSPTVGSRGRRPRSRRRSPRRGARRPRRRRAGWPSIPPHAKSVSHDVLVAVDVGIVHADLPADPVEVHRRTAEVHLACPFHESVERGGRTPPRAIEIGAIELAEPVRLPRACPCSGTRGPRRWLASTPMFTPPAKPWFWRHCDRCARPARCLSSQLNRARRLLALSTTRISSSSLGVVDRRAATRRGFSKWCRPLRLHDDDRERLGRLIDDARLSALA